MTRQIERRIVWIVCGALAVSGTAALAQSALTQLGVTEAEARQYVVENIENGGGSGSTIANAARRSYGTLAPTARASATTAFYTWTKAYVNSPAFKTAYARMRTERTPQLQSTTGTPEQEAQTTANDKVAEMEEMAKAIRPSIPPADRPKWEADLKEQLTMLRSKQMLDIYRAEIVEKRATDKADYDEAMGKWNKNLPADPMVRIAGILHDFLNATADVDFAAKTKMEMGEAGQFMAFVNPDYNKKPWQWREAFDYGPETLAAARASASAWLKELPAK